LKSLEQANSLWPGNISEDAMAAARKIIRARAEQQIQDAAAADADKANATNARATAAAAQAENASLVSNKDVIDMAQAKLSDQVIIRQVRTTKCRFDTSPSALIQMKKAGVSDAVVLAMTEAQCTR
jgi:hypothetical protein